MKFAKKILRVTVCVWVILGIVVFQGCSTGKPGPDFKPESGLSFSNLTDPESCEDVKSLLNNFISPESIKEFFSRVAEYNLLFKEILLTEAGFSGTESLKADYDTVTATQIWYDYSQNRYSDINCRVASFILMGEFITAGKEYTGAVNNLIFDLDIFDKFEFNLCEGKLNTFKALNGVMQPPKTENRQDIIDFIKEQWQEREVAFTSEDIFLINVFIHDVTFDELFIGHSGVLIPIDKGFVFVEKIAPALPYQVSVLQTEEQLITYLDAAFAQYNDPAGFKAIYMKNYEALN